MDVSHCISNQGRTELRGCQQDSREQNQNLGASKCQRDLLLVCTASVVSARTQTSLELHTVIDMVTLSKDLTDFTESEAPLLTMSCEFLGDIFLYMAASYQQ